MPLKKKINKKSSSKKIIKKKSSIKNKKVDKLKENKKEEQIIQDANVEKKDNIQNNNNINISNVKVKEEDSDNSDFSLSNSEEESIYKNNKIKKSINMYRKIAVSFILLTLLLLSLVIYFVFKSVTVILTPSKERISDNLMIDIYDKDSHSEKLNNSLIGVVKNIKIKEEKKYQSTGAKVLGEEVVGKVIISNNYSKNQQLVASTRLLSNDKLFRIKNTVNVPAGRSVEVEVYADKPDVSMAIKHSKFIIPGLWAGLQDKIYGESKEKFIYKKVVKKFIQQSDIDKGVNDLKKILIDNAKKQFSNSYDNFDEVLFKIDDSSIKVDISNKIDEEIEEFNIIVESMVVVVAFSQDEVKDLVEKKLLAITPDNKKIEKMDDKNIVYDLNSFNIDQGVATISSSFQTSMSLKSVTGIIDKNKIVGLTKEQLESYISSFKEIDNCEIKFSPIFVNKVPMLVDRIYIKIKK